MSDLKFRDEPILKLLKPHYDKGPASIVSLVEIQKHKRERSLLSL